VATGFRACTLRRWCLQADLRYSVRQNRVRKNALRYRACRELRGLTLLQIGREFSTPRPLNCCVLRRIISNGIVLECVSKLPPSSFPCRLRCPWAARRTVVSRELKRSGMFWTVPSANCYRRSPLLLTESPVRGHWSSRALAELIHNYVPHLTCQFPHRRLSGGWTDSAVEKSQEC
jgi:hypothetical protein